MVLYPFLIEIDRYTFDFYAKNLYAIKLKEPIFTPHKIISIRKFDYRAKLNEQLKNQRVSLDIKCDIVRFTGENSK